MEVQHLVIAGATSAVEEVLADSAVADAVPISIVSAGASSAVEEVLADPSVADAVPISIVSAGATSAVEDELDLLVVETSMAARTAEVAGAGLAVFGQDRVCMRSPPHWILLGLPWRRPALCTPQQELRPELLSGSPQAHQHQQQELQHSRQLRGQQPMLLRAWRWQRGLGGLLLIAVSRQFQMSLTSKMKLTGCAIVRSCCWKAGQRPQLLKLI